MIIASVFVLAYFEIMKIVCYRKRYFTIPRRWLANILDWLAIVSYTISSVYFLLNDLNRRSTETISFYVCALVIGMLKFLYDLRVADELGIVIMNILWIVCDVKWIFIPFGILNLFGANLFYVTKIWSAADPKPEYKHYLSWTFDIFFGEWSQ